MSRLFFFSSKWKLCWLVWNTYGDSFGQGASQTGFLYGTSCRSAIGRHGNENGNGRCDLFTTSWTTQPDHGSIRVDLYRVCETQNSQFRFVGQIVQHQPPCSAPHVFPVILYTRNLHTLKSIFTVLVFCVSSTSSRFTSCIIGAQKQNKTTLNPNTTRHLRNIFYDTRGKGNLTG